MYIKAYRKVSNKCKTCGGEGKITNKRYSWHKNTCPTCRGEGITTREEEVKIPLSHLNDYT